MTKTYELTKLEMVADFSTQIEGETYELAEGEVIAADRNVASNLMNLENVATHTGKKYSVERSEGEPKQRIITGLDEKQPVKTDDDFDFEAYVDKHNADPVIEDVKSSDSVAWLENLANHDERKTVQSAVEKRLDELEE